MEYKGYDTYASRFTCSSGCPQYGNRGEARNAQYTRKHAAYRNRRLEGVNARRKARKAQRQNRKRNHA